MQLPDMRAGGGGTSGWRSIWRYLPGARAWLGLPRLPASAPAHWRVRLAMYSVLVLVGVLSVWQAWRAEKSEAVRLADAEVIRIAGAQSMLTQRMGTMAVFMAVAGAGEVKRQDELGATINGAQEQARRLEELLESQGALLPDAPAPLRQAVDAWQNSRERLWYRAQLLLWHLERNDPAKLLAAIKGLQAEVEPALLTSQALVEQVQIAAQRRTRGAIEQIKLSALLTVLLLLGLALVVAEPLVRSVRRQHKTLRVQAEEMARLALVAERTSNAVAITDARRIIVWVNRAFTQINGYTMAEAVGVRFGQLMRVDQADPAAVERFRVATEQGRGIKAEHGVLHKSGRLLWVEADVQPIHDEAGALSAWVIVQADLTDTRAQQQMLALAVDGAALGTWQWDMVSNAMFCNERLLEMFGYQYGEVEMTAQSWNAHIHPDDLAGWRACVRTHLDDPRIKLRMEVRLRHRDGYWQWLMFSGAVVTRRPDGTPLRMAGVCLDMNAQKALEEQLRQAARTDGLTQLPNRAVVLDRICNLMARRLTEPGYHFAVLFMDFDRFKQVNDTLGHSVGDELLRQIAQRLRDSLRPGDAFVRTSDFSQMAARIGGDEFVVVLDDIRGGLDAQVVAGRLLDVLAQPYVIGPHRVHSTVSIGIVTSEHAGDDADSVLRDADIAMYEAKHAGRGCYVMFDPAMRKRVRDDVALENDLRQALAKGELFVVYQPLVDLAGGELAGVEALVRWNHPQRGLVSPAEFIALAEATGLIGQIGLFVLQTACHEFANMQAILGDESPPTVAVNLSRAQLRQPGLAALVLDVLRASGLACAQLILEVTESLAAQDEVVQATLREIRALGIALSLDDFGTGYSSLACLHELPVNFVKIDRSFVAQAQLSDYHRVLIDATIRMAQALGLTTVAEGIETPEQAALMKRMGCGKGQGFLYSEPLTAYALIQWITALHEPI